MYAADLQENAIIPTVKPIAALPSNHHREKETLMRRICNATCIYFVLKEVKNKATKNYRSNAYY